MRIGFYPLSAKPFHKGHYAVIQQSAQENDAVILLVSLADRVRKDEYPVYGKTMARLWRDYYSAIMPANIKMFYTYESPVKKTFEFVEKASADDVVSVYGGGEDAERYFADVPEHIRVCAIPRTDISGTKMRQYLKEGRKTEFMEGLPLGLDAESVWYYLSSQKP